MVTGTNHQNSGTINSHFTSTDESLNPETFCRRSVFKAIVGFRYSALLFSGVLSSISLCLWTTSDNRHKVADSDFTAVVMFCKFRERGPDYSSVRL